MAPRRTHRNYGAAAAVCGFAVLALLLAGCGKSSESSGTPSSTSESSTVSASTGAETESAETESAETGSAEAENTGSGKFPATQKVVAYDEANHKPAKKYKLAYLAECITENAYCESRFEGFKAAASKYGFTYKYYDAEFSTSKQLGDAQDASAAGFDGYIIGPNTSASGCSLWKQYIKPSGAPLVDMDTPLCESTTYTPGLAATITMQRQAYFEGLVNIAFKACKGKCEAAAIGGFNGSELYGDWEKAIEAGEKAYPNVTVVANQPANFEPSKGNEVIADAFRAHPNISIILSSWDAMTVGALRAVVAAGKTPGSEVKIYSVGGSKEAVEKLKSGEFTVSYILLPYEEGYYSAVALIMALEGEPLNGYIEESELPAVKELGTLAVTSANAAKFHPRY